MLLILEKNLNNSICSWVLRLQNPCLHWECLEQEVGLNATDTRWEFTHSGNDVMEPSGFQAGKGSRSRKNSPRGCPLGNKCPSSNCWVHLILALLLPCFSTMVVWLISYDSLVPTVSLRFLLISSIVWPKQEQFTGCHGQSHHSQSCLARVRVKGLGQSNESQDIQKTVRTWQHFMVLLTGPNCQLACIWAV